MGEFQLTIWISKDTQNSMHIFGVIPGTSAKALMPEFKGLVQRNHFRRMS